jgi:hypothetical protein
MADTGRQIIRPGGNVVEGTEVMLSPEYIAKAVDARIDVPVIGDFIKWVKNYGGKKDMTEPPKPKEGKAGGYSEDKPYVDRRLLDYAKAYSRISRNVSKYGIEKVELPSDLLYSLTGNRKGFEEDGIIYVASDQPDKEKTQVTVHELMSILTQDITGIDHDSTHPFIVPLQNRIAATLALN